MNIIDRTEATKIQMAEAHRYVQQFLTLRATFFAAMLTAVGVLLSKLNDYGDSGRFGAWIGIGAIQFIGLQSIASATRSIWLMLCYMFMIERDLYGTGGSHQWLLSNLRNYRYSTTFGLYSAMMAMAICTILFFSVDTLINGNKLDIQINKDYNIGLDIPFHWVILALGILLQLFLVVKIRKEIHPKNAIAESAEEAVRVESPPARPNGRFRSLPPKANT